MAKHERYQLLEAAVSNLENANGRSSQQDLCQELCDIAAQWPAEDEDEDHEAASSGIFLRLEEALVKFFPPAIQTQVVQSFRPLKAEVSRRLSQWTNEFNDVLHEGPNLPAQQLAQLGDLLREVEASPQLMWYRQCPKARVKAKFLMAAANLARATSGSLKIWVEAQPLLPSLVQKIVNKLFVLPSMGNILTTWHEGRLACYNATLSLAAQRAAEKMKDELQVSLVSAVKRATAGDESRPKQSLELKMREWPMSGCPLARALLEFLKSHAVDLGDLGRPNLKEIPPHSLKPETLRSLLCHLDAFDVGPGPQSLVKLRFEAVAALAYKAVGTKPKAKAAPQAMSPPQGLVETNMDGFDFTDVTLMSRLIRRGMQAQDEDWRQAWTQFCWKKGISSRLSSRNPVTSPELLASFVESHLLKLKRAPWARSLLEPGEAELRPRSSLASRSRDEVHRSAHRELRAVSSHERRASRRPRDREELEWSSSFSESRRRKKRSRRDKKYGDKYLNSTMMMRAQMMRAQMMGVSMVMNQMNSMNSMNSMMGMNMTSPMIPAAPTYAVPPPAAPPAPPAPPAPGPTRGRAPMSKPLAEAAAAARKQQASSIDMDDL